MNNNSVFPAPKGPTWRSVIATSLVLAALVCFSSCARGEDDPKDSAETTPTAAENVTTPAGTTTAADTTTAAPTALRLVADGKTDYVIIRPENAGEYNVKAATTLRQAISAATGVDIRISTDWHRRDEQVDQTLPEIILGQCDRDASAGLADSLDERSFIIKVEGNKLMICGKTEKLTMQAVDYFISTYLTGENVSDSTITLPLTLKDIQTNVKFDMTQLINSTDSYTTVQEKLFDIKNVDNYKIMQGGCTDGKYLYMAMENQTFASDNHHSYIYKYDLETMKQVARSEALQLDHSNDICYNPDTGMLVVVHNAPRRTKISFVDPETLSVTGTKNLSYEIFSIAYNGTRQQYVIGLSHGQNFMILDKDFNRVKMCTVQSTGYTTQGMECDDDFIYFIQYNKNVIVVYDWSGKRVNIIDVSLNSGEPENICLVNDVFYVGCNNAKWTGGAVYKMQIIKK